MQTDNDSDPLLVYKSFLKLPSFKDTPQGEYWKWFIDESKRCSTETLSNEELEQVQELLSYHKVGLLPRPKMCYYFSQIACVATRGKLQYYEGQAISMIPTDHAWLMYDGKVVDAVWGTLEHTQSPDGFSAGSKQHYTGIEIPYSIVMRSVASGIAEPILPEFYQQQS